VENGELPAIILPDGPLRRQLAYYPPGLDQDAHGHHEPHVSVVIAGSFLEVTPAGERLVCQGQAGFRADGARHAVRYGPSGALVLTLDFADWVADGAPPASGVDWVPASAFLPHAPAPDDWAECLLDLWALRDPPERVHADRAPHWLREAAEEMLAEPGPVAVAALAARCGVHRVHFSRLFTRHFGIAPSSFRRRSMAARAIAASLHPGTSLAAAAADAGFADQSHMARTLRESCGMGAGRLRALLTRHVTSVQARVACPS